MVLFVPTKHYGIFYKIKCDTVILQNEIIFLVSFPGNLWLDMTYL